MRIKGFKSWHDRACGELTEMGMMTRRANIAMGAVVTFIVLDYNLDYK